jgi:hypothetical protein
MSHGAQSGLELFRQWLLNSDSGFPDPLRQQDAERSLADLTKSPVKAARGAERLAQEVPLELRVGIHHLFTGASDYGDEDYPPSDLAEISDYIHSLKTDDLSRLLDAASWLGLLRDGGTSGRVHVPYGSVLGLLIRQPRFAAP